MHGLRHLSPPCKHEKNINVNGHPAIEYSFSSWMKKSLLTYPEVGSTAILCGFV